MVAGFEPDILWCLQRIINHRAGNAEKRKQWNKFRSNKSRQWRKQDKSTFLNFDWVKLSDSNLFFDWKCKTEQTRKIPTGGGLRIGREGNLNQSTPIKFEFCFVMNWMNVKTFVFWPLVLVQTLNCNSNVNTCSHCYDYSVVSSIHSFTQYPY